ncbi:hypothetical protein K439DRAFT_921592 [Ramaria rubella]|nr:hypothetical protein K439DRAFT_921592 [Ramaria rubella]
MASPIPDRDNLESMSRTDIQRLCKDNNIKANMRTDEMINALCDLLNGKSVPRPHRATSTSDRAVSQAHPKSRRSLQPPASKPSEPSKKAALQPSESNTDAESQSDTTPPSAAPAPPPSAPQSTSSTPATTRRKAQDIQTHLGKGRPVVAGGSGARNVTKPFSRGARRGKKSAMLREDVIVEGAWGCGCVVCACAVLMRSGV